METGIISVINTNYCKPHPITIKIETDKGVAYINNEVIFRIKESFSLKGRRVIYDVSGNHVSTLSKKIISMHDRWEVFKGRSIDSSDLLFTVKRSTFFIPEKKNIDFNVYLAKNIKGVWDFKVCAGAEKKSCDISAHGSSSLLAKTFPTSSLTPLPPMEKNRRCSSNQRTASCRELTWGNQRSAPHLVPSGALGTALPRAAAAAATASNPQPPLHGALRSPLLPAIPAPETTPSLRYCFFSGAIPFSRSQGNTAAMSGGGVTTIGQTRRRSLPLRPDSLEPVARPHRERPLTNRALHSSHLRCRGTVMVV